MFTLLRARGALRLRILRCGGFTVGVWETFVGLLVAKQPDAVATKGEFDLEHRSHGLIGTLPQAKYGTTVLTMLSSGLDGAHGRVPAPSAAA